MTVTVILTVILPVTPDCDPDCDPACSAELLDELPRLELDDRRTLDRDSSLQEVQQLSKRRSPRINHLPAEFDQQGLLGRDYYETMQARFRRGEVPISCQRAVLSLPPQKRDLGLLKSWRSVFLMYKDYDILSKDVANRLKGYLNVLIKKNIFCFRWGINSLFLGPGQRWIPAPVLYVARKRGMRGLLNTLLGSAEMAIWGDIGVRVNYPVEVYRGSVAG